MHQTRNEHHFTPAGLLRPWQWNDNLLRGYWWDARKQAMKCKPKGVKGFCFQLHLLTLHSRRAMPDVLEHEFEHIDTRGCIVKDKLVAGDIGDISRDEREAFSRLLMSLQVRDPVRVGKLRAAALRHMQDFDSDPEVRRVFHEEGVEGVPSDWVKVERGASIDDSLFESVLRSVRDRQEVVDGLAAAHWETFKLSQGDGTLLLADMPLMMHGGPLSKKADWFWFLPLSPKVGFAVSKSRTMLAGLRSMTGQRFVKFVNPTSARNARRYVFASDTLHEHWLPKHLRRSWEERSSQK